MYDFGKSLQLSVAGVFADLFCPGAIVNILFSTQAKEKLLMSLLVFVMCILEYRRCVFSTAAGDQVITAVYLYSTCFVCTHTHTHTNLNYRLSYRLVSSGPDVGRVSESLANLAVKLTIDLSYVITGIITKLGALRQVNDVLCTF